MPRPADPRIRTQLIDAAARLLAEHGPDGLTTRQLSAAVGTSTMAVYTYFRGMDELRHAVRVEGFERLARFLDEVDETDDPVADVASLGAAYFLNAVTNPHLYRFMFMEPPLDDEPDVGHATFERLIGGVRRAVEAGRFTVGGAEDLATQLWAMAHGIVTLHLAGLLTVGDAVAAFAQMGLNLFVGFGDDRARAQRSVETVRQGLDIAV